MTKKYGERNIRHLDAHPSSIRILLSYTSQAYHEPAMKFGSDTQSAAVYEAAHQASHLIVGGTCPSVVLARGYMPGGGHSVLSSTHGLSADEVLE